METKNNTSHTEEQEAINRMKYGDKTDDVIARAYREEKRIGDIWCAKNVEKYLKRFISRSPKSDNIVDLRKAHDYLSRMLEINEECVVTHKLTKEEITEKQ